LLPQASAFNDQYRCKRGGRVQALKDVLAQLKSVGESARIVEVAYKYREIVEGKTQSTAAKPLRVVMTTAAKEGPKELDAKKAMLGAHARCTQSGLHTCIGPAGPHMSCSLRVACAALHMHTMAS
jgi:hypothetical protein